MKRKLVLRMPCEHVFGFVFFYYCCCLFYFCFVFCKHFHLLHEYSFVCFLFLMIRMIFNLHHYISLAYFVPSLAVHCFNLEKKITVNFLITINNQHLGNDFEELDISMVLSNSGEKSYRARKTSM